MTAQVIRPLRTHPYVAVYDPSAGVYEVFRDADCDSYVGCADTLGDCEHIARDHAAESEVSQLADPQKAIAELTRLQWLQLRVLVAKELQSASRADRRARTLRGSEKAQARYAAANTLYLILERVTNR